MGDTLGNITTRTRLYLREPDAATSYWSDAFLAQMFNAAYRRRCAQLIMAYEGYFTAVATRSIVANKARYAMPSGTLRILKLERVLENGTSVPMRRFERHEEVNFSIESNLTGDYYLPNFRPMANGFILEPSPTENISNGLRLELAILPELLTGSSDRTHESFPEIFEELLVLDTAVAALAAQGAMETGQMKAIAMTRAEMEQDFGRFIENRAVMISETVPFIPGYWDA